jgi:hypothetical protein
MCDRCQMSIEHMFWGCQTSKTPLAAVSREVVKCYSYTHTSNIL